MPAPLPPKDRIKRNCTIGENGCWNWHSVGSDGYGRIGVNYKRKLAHRVAYEDFVGAIPDGLQLDHLCFNHRCVNPAHLEPVTGEENRRRAGQAGLMDHKSHHTHCKYGHEYTDENTRWTPQGHRDCRTCGRDKMRRLRSEWGGRTAPT
jgi:hypothetical protein